MPTSVNARARFRVVSVNDPETGVKTLQLCAVQNNSPENQAFFKSAAGQQFAMLGSSNISLAGLAPGVDELFTPGREFFVDFTPAA